MKYDEELAEVKNIFSLTPVAPISKPSPKKIKLNNDGNDNSKMEGSIKKESSNNYIDESAFYDFGIKIEQKMLILKSQIAKD